MYLSVPKWEFINKIRESLWVLMHAGPSNIWRAPMDTANDAELETTYAKLNAEIVVYCHIHRTFIRKVGSMTVCNTGSVGAPYDGGPRASYLMIDDGKPAIRRVVYDVEKEVGRLLASNYPYKEWIAEMRRKGVTSRRRRRIDEATSCASISALQLMLRSRGFLVFVFREPCGLRFLRRGQVR